jgi:hypothetical protein
MRHAARPSAARAATARDAPRRRPFEEEDESPFVGLLKVEAA